MQVVRFNRPREVDLPEQFRTKLKKRDTFQSTCWPMNVSLLTVLNTKIPKIFYTIKKNEMEHNG